MKIGELSKLSGMARSQIRYYESRGLVPVRRQPNGYRDYPNEALLILEIITTAKRSDFSLDEISTILPAGAGRWDHEQIVASLERKVVDIVALQERLNDTREQLLRLITFVKTRRGDNECLDNVRDALDSVKQSTSNVDIDAFATP
jgi:DNA-binding transcriptional MerR regulator